MADDVNVNTNADVNVQEKGKVWLIYQTDADHHL